MKKRFLIGGIISFLALAYLGFSFASSFTYYLTPSELKTQDSIYGKKVRVNGKVAPESITWDAKDLILKFHITDDRESLPVIYKGVVPDTFKVGGDVVVEGSYSPQGTFQANRLLVKCPTKYTPGDKKP